MRMGIRLESTTCSCGARTIDRMIGFPESDTHYHLGGASLVIVIPAITTSTPAICGSEASS